MISKAQRRNAERIVTLADKFGHLYYNASGQTPEATLNLSIPTARLVIAGVVTGVDPETNDGINDAAVADVVRTCRRAVDYCATTYAAGGENRPVSLWPLWLRAIVGSAASLLGRPSELEARKPATVPVAKPELDDYAGFAR